MEEKAKIIFREKAKRSILEIAIYIELQGYPETAEKFTERLLLFANTISIFPDKYPLCRYKQFSKRNFHCAVFEHNYIFVYKIVRNHLVIFQVIHSKRLK